MRRDFGEPPDTAPCYLLDETGAVFFVGPLNFARPRDWVLTCRARKVEWNWGRLAGREPAGNGNILIL
jgi:hypothetical protein